MAFTVSDFRSRVRDLAKQYMFEISVLMPVAVGTSELVNILAQSTSIPGRTITPVDANFMGQQYKLAGNIEFSPWSVEFRMDDNYDVYKKFRAWSELVRGTETNIAAFPAQYKSEPIIYQLDAAGNKLNQITLKGAWPSEIGEIAVDTTSSELQVFSVTWEYDQSLFLPL